MKYRFIIAACLLSFLLISPILFTEFYINTLSRTIHSDIFQKTKKFIPKSFKKFIKENSLHHYFLIEASVKKLKKNQSDKNILIKKKFIQKHFLLNRSQVKVNKEDIKGTKLNNIDNNIELYSVKFYGVTEFGIMKKK